MEKLEKTGIVSLNYDELLNINGGGESGWYWVMYGISNAINYLNEAGQGNRLHSAG